MQRLNDHFDKVIHRVSLKISKRCFRINQPFLNIRNDIVYLGIRKEEGARGKTSHAVEFPPDLLLELGEVNPRDDLFGVKSVHWVGCIALGHGSHIHLNLDRLRQRVMAVIEEAE